jgi:DNA-binding NtrC family response regulator
LENIVERAVVLSAKDRLELELPNASGNGGFKMVGLGGVFHDSKRKVIESFETHYLTTMLRRHKGNISSAAKESGLDYKNFHDKLKKYRIKRSAFED